MKKTIIGILTVLLTLSLFATGAAAEFIPEEKENYNASQIMTAENGGNGFTFYAQRPGEEPVLCVSETGEWESICMASHPGEGVNPDIDAIYWENDVKGSDSYMFVDVNGGDLLINYTSPVAGKLSFSFEAALVEHEAAEGEDGISISVERADGTKLGDPVDVVKNGTAEWGNYKRSGGNALGKATFEVAEGETVTVRFSRKDNGDNDRAAVWFELRYARIGEEVTTPLVTTAEQKDTGAGTTAKPTETGAVTTAPAGNGTAAVTGESGSEDSPVGLIIGIAAAAVVVIAVILVLVLKKKKPAKK